MTCKKIYKKMGTLHLKAKKCSKADSVAIVAAAPAAAATLTVAFFVTVSVAGTADAAISAVDNGAGAIG